LTNINLVFNQVDDYFDTFTTPSITRHLWTLSIEEQYYIIWPFFMYMITRFTVGKDQKAFEDKVYVKCIMTLDACVMIGSVLSSLITIERMGTSAAYFSTLCRMGDIAIGGFVYTGTRLLPSIDARMKAAYTDESGCVVKPTPLTMKQKIFCEFTGYIGLIGVFTFSMVQVDVDTMLFFYFNGGRFFTVIFTLVITALCIFAGDGPLPWWAITSKFWCSRILAFIGVLSYGLYMYHWPIIVFFGDPNGSHRKKVKVGLEEDDGSDDHYMLRDLVIWIIVMILAYISFAFYEKPALLYSRKNKPSRTLTAGFTAMAITLFTIWAVTKDLPPRISFENDADNLFDQVIEPAPVDDRMTPVLTTIQPKQMYMVLDMNSRAEFRDMTGPNGTNVMLSKYPIYQPGGEKNANVTIFVECAAEDHFEPCDSDFWVQPTYWFWLKSDFCSSYENGGKDMKIDPNRCESKVHQQMIHYNTEDGLTYMEKSEPEVRTDLQKIILAADKRFQVSLTKKHCG
jgi:peptidoglycan/LPS O-acetylase OafA/YrhL